MRRAGQFVAAVGPPLALLTVVIALWQAATVAGDLPAYVLPSPLRVFEAARVHRAALWAAALRTGGAALLGALASLAAGVAIGLAFSQSQVLARSAYPYAIFLQTVPIVAIAPVIVTWFGTGFFSVVLVAFTISLFPIITAATTGLLQVDPRLVELFELAGASRWQTLVKLRLPHSVPYLVTGSKTSCGLAVVGAIVGESFVGYDLEHFGLGYLIMQSASAIKADYLFAAILASTLLGVLFFAAANFAGATILARWHVYDRAAQPQTSLLPRANDSQ